MQSPFPGMDPYLEDPALWPDFHGTFLMAVRAELNKLLPEHYVARWDRYVWIDEPEADAPCPLGRPDVFVSDTLNRQGGNGGEAVFAGAPTTATLPIVEPKGKPFLKILDVRGNRVVTVIELLSYANKSGRDRNAYLAKREEYFRSGVNLVELDLLRSGQRPPVDSEVQPADYYIVICQGVDYPKAGVWPLGVRDPLPVIPIPLDPQVEAVKLALRPCLDRAYEEGRFADEIDYQQPPNPPLSDADAVWARELVRTR